ncbi:MAG: sigma-70 family RNA polymerase sigma factor [Solirubrobacterales bacterium]|nr:sigma-70 family RNA polymerase sigma factor [Solirubrobacterales bacterium]
MTAAATISTARERELLAAARGGDEGAYARLIETYRGELHAHCYRMLGSVHDAEDALQEALLRAWRALARFEGRSSLRSWLYRIATNTCLTAIQRRPKRVLPIDYGPASDPHDGPGEPLVESVWIEPYPDETLGVEDGLAAPEASYERREGVELAFIAALQHLPARQRAALILREVLGFSAKETAAALETTVASVNSALQRARKTIEERLPDQSQQATARSLGDDGVRDVVESYVDAWDRGDIDGVVAMLTEDAAFAMPPLASWFGGRDGGHDALSEFLAVGPLSGEWRWRHVPARANGQPALAFYGWDEEQRTHLPFALNMLTLRGERISDITAFVCRSIELPGREAYARWPDQPLDATRTAGYFERFGLPDRLD